MMFYGYLEEMLVEWKMSFYLNRSLLGKFTAVGRHANYNNSSHAKSSTHHQTDKPMSVELLSITYADWTRRHHNLYIALETCQGS